MRAGETVNLTWSDVNINEGIVHVRAKQNEKGEVMWIPKTGEDRKIPISPDMRSLLSEQRKRCLGPWVFPNNQGNRYKNNLYRDFKTALVKIGITDRSCDTHSCRRSYASFHATRGTPAKVLHALMGHANFLTTMNVYAQITSDDVKQAAQISLYGHNSGQIRPA